LGEPVLCSTATTILVTSASKARGEGHGHPLLLYSRVRSRYIPGDVLLVQVAFSAEVAKDRGELGGFGSVSWMTGDGMVANAQLAFPLKLITVWLAESSAFRVTPAGSKTPKQMSASMRIRLAIFPP